MLAFFVTSPWVASSSVHQKFHDERLVRAQFHSSSRGAEAGNQRLIYLEGSRLLIVTQTSDNRFDHSLGFSGAFDRNGNDSGLFSRVVVSSWEQGIPDVNHLLHGN